MDGEVLFFLWVKVEGAGCWVLTRLPIQSNSEQYELLRARGSMTGGLLASIAHLRTDSDAKSQPGLFSLRPEYARANTAGAMLVRPHCLLVSKSMTFFSWLAQEPLTSPPVSISPMTGGNFAVCI